MNKKGVFNIIIDLLIILVVLFVILATLYFGIWKKAEGIAEQKLPAGEKLRLLIDKFTTSPGEAEIQKQEVQANKIADAIKRTINQMNDADCIEQIDFSDVTDKDFTLEFKLENSETKLEIYKIINNQKAYPFDYPFNIPVYYSVIKSSETASIEDVTEFKINNLQEIEFNKEKEKLNSFLYKDKEEKIIFSSNIFYSIYKIKQICSDGKYLGDINLDEFINNDYNKVIISETRYTKENKEVNIYMNYLGSFKKYEDLWYKEGFEDKFPIYNDENMVKLINILRTAKFRVELI